jgi:hypothetical protein
MHLMVLNWRVLSVGLFDRNFGHLEASRMSEIKGLVSAIKGGIGGTSKTTTWIIREFNQPIQHR